MTAQWGIEARKALWAECQVFSSAASALQQLVGEEKFAPAPEKNISLTWAQNFLSEVGSSKGKVKNGK